MSRVTEASLASSEEEQIRTLLSGNEFRFCSHFLSTYTQRADIRDKVEAEELRRYHVVKEQELC